VGQRNENPARLAGGISLTLWIAIIACGRIVGWTAS
jgi:hypothetical protein